MHYTYKRKTLQWKCSSAYLFENKKRDKLKQNKKKANQPNILKLHLKKCKENTLTYTNTHTQYIFTATIE